MAEPDWTRIRAEFARIEEAPAPERAALVAALDPDVRAEVDSLLAALDAAGGFLSLPEGPVPGPGATLGAYVLREEIGRGGMGVVYRAERHDGQFDKQVAVKIADGRLFAPEAERRFLQEGRILARLDHPHIVRLLDAGVSAGHRYFVMELVQGAAITDFAARHALDLAARSRRFLDVCAAIHYAHQHLVLHRDLKPGNIIVTDDGTVKVLDFGIAQVLLDETGSAAGGTTALHPLSFGCASPEQMRGEPLSLASDVYALGVLLYELATGVNPQFRPGATFQETFRRVVHEAPVPPSRVARGLPRDLDAIVLKALAREPRDRYASVAELQADVDRLLTARPVLARRPSPPYVFGRFVRRNTGLSTMAALLLVAIGVGTAASVVQARTAKRRFDDARQLIHSVIFDLQPRLEAIPATLPIRQALIEQTMRYLESVSREAGGNVELLVELSNAYQQLARVQGDVTTSSLGHQVDAADRYGKADALMARATAAAPRDPDVLKAAALLYARLAGFDNTQGRSDAAFLHARQALAFAERNQAARPGEFDAREIVAVSVFYLGVAAPATDWQMRVDTFERANALYRTLAAELPAKEGLARNVGITERYLASLYHDKSQHTQARDHGLRALEVSEQTLARRPPDPALRLEVMTDAGLVGTYLDAVGDYSAGARLYHRAIDLADALVSEDAGNARARILLAEAARNLGRNRLAVQAVPEAQEPAARAVAIYDVLEHAGQLAPGLRWRFANAMATLADAEQAAGQPALACADYRRAVQMFDEADRQEALIDLVKVDADRARASLAECRPPGP